MHAHIQSGNPQVVASHPLRSQGETTNEPIVELCRCDSSHINKYLMYLQGLPSVVKQACSLNYLTNKLFSADTVELCQWYHGCSMSQWIAISTIGWCTTHTP